MRTKINVILGVLIALLSGCKTQKDITPNDRIMVLYGPPAYFEENSQNIEESLEIASFENREEPLKNDED